MNSRFVFYTEFDLPQFRKTVFISKKVGFVEPVSAKGENG